jgi:UDPglucose 6-dehydrogenase
LNPRVCVYGLWHLGCVTAACLASAGFHVVGLDPDEATIQDLQNALPPIAEPGLADLIRVGIETRHLSFTSDPVAALSNSDILWLCFDTPLDATDNADSDWVRARMDSIERIVRPKTLILISSQVPVGFTEALQKRWRRNDSTLLFAYSPENLQLGRALESFRNPVRVVVGAPGGDSRARDLVVHLFTPFTEQIDWVSYESAEMTKHALNTFLALSGAYANELARICERVGADALEVERGLRSDPRVGSKPYLSPGAPIAGGTLLRDVTVLAQLASRHNVSAPIVSAVRESNDAHRAWARDVAGELLRGIDSPKVAILGLTYKAGTDTLRGSSALDFGRWLVDRGIRVAAYDPAIRQLPAGYDSILLAANVEEALSAADVAFIATPWPVFRSIDAEQLSRQMRRVNVIDQAGFLPGLATDPRVRYVRVGLPRNETL